MSSLEISSPSLVIFRLIDAVLLFFCREAYQEYNAYVYSFWVVKCCMLLFTSSVCRFEVYWEINPWAFIHVLPRKSFSTILLSLTSNRRKKESAIFHRYLSTHQIILIAQLGKVVRVPLADESIRPEHHASFHKCWSYNAETSPRLWISESSTTSTSGSSLPAPLSNRWIGRIHNDRKERMPFSFRTWSHPRWIGLDLHLYDGLGSTKSLSSTQRDASCRRSISVDTLVRLSETIRYCIEETAEFSRQSLAGGQLQCCLCLPRKSRTNLVGYQFVFVICQRS